MGLAADEMLVAEEMHLRPEKVSLAAAETLVPIDSGACRNAPQV